MRAAAFIMGGRRFSRELPRARRRQPPTARADGNTIDRQSAALRAVRAWTRRPIRRAHAVQPLTAIQNEYSMLWRGPENTDPAVCVRNSASASCHGHRWAWASPPEPSPHSRVSPKVTSAPHVPRNSRENLAANMPLVQLISRTGRCARAPLPAQISLAWLMAQQPWIVPIPSTTRTAHLAENLGAEEVTFSGDELRELNTALAGNQRFTVNGCSRPRSPRPASKPARCKGLPQ